MKNDLISQYSAYHLKQNVESRGKKAWIKLTNYCTKCPFAYPTWSAHELHPVLLELLHSGEFMTAHDGYAGECRFNFADKNLCWSTYRLNFMRNSSYEQFEKCVPGEPAKEQSDENKPTCTVGGSYDLVTRCAKCNKEIARSHVTEHPLGHDWDDGVLTIPATQFDAGVITYTCKRDGCGATKAVAISPTHAEHQWGKVEYAWEKDGSKVKASRSCTVCGLMESETAELDESGTSGPGKVTKAVIKQATCEEAGKATYTAAFENSVFQSASVELEDSPALGHDWEKNGEASKEPSCEAEGITVYSCKREGCGKTKEETLPALGHEWPEYKEPDTVVVTVNVEPTCESEGEYSEKYYCERCKTLLEEKKIAIAALGHDWGEWTLIAQSGDTPAYYERVCKNNSTHVERKDAGMPAATDLTEVAEVPAACTQAGSKKHWVYGGSGGEAQDGFSDRYFVQMEEGDTAYIELSDGTKLKEVDKEDVVLSALGHQWGDPSYEWADDGQSVKASHACVREGCKGTDGDPAREVETASVEQGTIAVEVSTPASCTERGSHLYTPTFRNQDFENGKNTKTVEDIPKVSHDWASPSYDWADDYSKVTATHKCRNCSESETETATQENGGLTAVIAKEATETETGKTVYTANFVNFEQQVKTVIVPMVNPGTQDDPEVLDKAFTVTFVDGQGNTLKTATVEKGNAATAPDDPTREDYTFDGWDKDFSNVTSDLTVTAKWKQNAVPEPGNDPEKSTTPEPGSDPNQMGVDGTPVGSGASAAAADKAITSMEADKDLKGFVFSKLAPKSPKQKKASIELKWNKVDNAKKYVIYGNKCGKKYKPKKLATVTSNKKVLKKIAGKKLKKGTYYKFIIVALDENSNVVSTSKLIHVATKGGKVGNHKKVTVKKAVIAKAKALKKGESLRIKAKAVAESKKLKTKKHVAVRYESTDESIATVSKKGVVKAKREGTCYVYAFAQDGAFKKIKVAIS